MLPLTIEQHRDQLYFTHYKSLNGDSFIDAEMVFKIGDRGNLSLTETASYNHFTGGVLRNKDHSFAKLLSQNLLEQGWPETISKTREEMKQTELNVSRASEVQTTQEPVILKPELTQEDVIAETKASEPENPKTQATEKNLSMTPKNWAKVAQTIGHKPDYVEKVILVQDKPLSENAIAAMTRDFDAYNNNLDTLREWYAYARALDKPEDYMEEIRQIASDFKEGIPLTAKIQDAARQDWSEVKFKQFAHGVEETPNSYIREVAKNALEQGSDRHEWRPMPFKDINDILIKGNSGLSDALKIRPDGVQRYVKQCITEAIKQLPKEKQVILAKADPNYQENLQQSIPQQLRNRGPSL